MRANLRSTLMRLSSRAVAFGLLLRAILFDRSDLPYAIGIMAAAIAYEALYQIASRSILERPYAANATPAR
jgi:hypothetical protein